MLRTQSRFHGTVRSHACCCRTVAGQCVESQGGAGTLQSGPRHITEWASTFHLGTQQRRCNEMPPRTPVCREQVTLQRGFESTSWMPDSAGFARSCSEVPGATAPSLDCCPLRPGVPWRLGVSR